MSLRTVLPNPVNQVFDRDDEQSTVKGEKKKRIKIENLKNKT